MIIDQQVNETNKRKSTDIIFKFLTFLRISDINFELIASTDQFNDLMQLRDRYGEAIFRDLVKIAVNNSGYSTQEILREFSSFIRGT